MTSCCDKRLRIIDPRSDADSAAQVRLVVYSVKRHQSSFSNNIFSIQETEVFANAKDSRAIYLSDSNYVLVSGFTQVSVTREFPTDCTMLM